MRCSFYIPLHTHARPPQRSAAHSHRSQYGSELSLSLSLLFSLESLVSLALPGRLLLPLYITF